MSRTTGRGTIFEWPSSERARLAIFFIQDQKWSCQREPIAERLQFLGEFYGAGEEPAELPDEDEHYVDDLPIGESDPMNDGVILLTARP